MRHGDWPSWLTPIFDHCYLRGSFSILNVIVSLAMYAIRVCTDAIGYGGLYVYGRTMTAIIHFNPTFKLGRV